MRRPRIHSRMTKNRRPPSSAGIGSMLAIDKPALNRPVSTNNGYQKPVSATYVTVSDVAWAMPTRPITLASPGAGLHSGLGSWAIGGNFGQLHWSIKGHARDTNNVDHAEREDREQEVHARASR